MVRRIESELVRDVKAAPRRSPWNARRFAAEGTSLIKGMFRAGRIVTRLAEKRLERKLFKLHSQLVKRVAARVESSAKAAGVPNTKLESVSLDLGNFEPLWQRVIEDEVRKHDLPISTAIVTETRSTYDTAVNGTLAMLGLDDERLRGAVARDSTLLAQRITNISDATRDRLRELLEQAIAKSQTVSEVADKLRSTMTDWAEHRVRTVARTETMLAWNEATARAMQASGAVTHVSVIGCESREEDRWKHPSFQQFTYRGEGTCNIRDVPVEDAARLRFHPNHTGVMVPSRMRDTEEPETNAADADMLRPPVAVQPELTEFDAAMAERCDKCVEKVGERMEEHVRRLAAANGMSPEQYKEAVEKRLADLTSRCSVFTRVPGPRTLSKIIQEGFKPKTSRIRVAIEENVMGVPATADRPVYGYLYPHHDGGIQFLNGPAAEYGNMVVKWKDTVRRDASVIWHDSFHAVEDVQTTPQTVKIKVLSAASPLNRPRWYSGLNPAWTDHDPLARDLEIDITGQNPRYFFEVQIQRKLTIDDVEEVFFNSAARPEPELLRELEKRGIPYTFVKES